MAKRATSFLDDTPKKHSEPHKRLTRKLRKSHQSHKSQHALSIPELRNAFEYIESFAHNCKGDVKAFREEWKKVFYKELDKESAQSYLEHIASSKKTTKRGGAALAGAPLDYTLRPGIHIMPGGLNANSYAQVPNYVANGFWNPEPARLLDPLPQQYRFPTSVPAGMGDNTVRGGGCGCNLMQGGKRNKTRRLRKGGCAPCLIGEKMPQAPVLGGGVMDAVQATLMRPFQMSSPMNQAQSLSEVAAGRSGGPSPQSADPTFKFARA